MAEAQITLSYSRDVGIVAIASGEQYPWAHTALEETGFRRGEAGVYHLPRGASRATLVDLIRCAARHRTSVTTSSRRFIGDAAGDIARLLPGQWDTTVEIYSHPAWQEDLVPWIWDSGELGRALQTERIPYAATLTHADTGTTLLLVEQPGHQLNYLIGAFAPQPLDDGYGDPHAPRSIVLPPLPGHAAHAISDRYLPSYERAVHARRTEAVAAALQGIRSEHETWAAMVASGRYSDATPLSTDALGAVTEEFLDHSWRSFLTVVDHAPVLLDRCRPATSPWPQDADALAHLAGALTDAAGVRDSLAHGEPLPRQETNARLWPAIETWLAEGETFLRQVRVSAPHRGPALAVSAPSRSLPAAGPARRH
ncbi:hypothetical protein [Streptomyces sp. NPDC059928]|uniref:hypothetical protein n=1 Tax=unclassified Streptomyces TaxID=2593676 RepID=UPI003652BEA7